MSDKRFDLVSNGITTLHTTRYETSMVRGLQTDQPSPPPQLSTLASIPSTGLMYETLVQNVTFPRQNTRLIIDRISCYRIKKKYIYIYIFFNTSCTHIVFRHATLAGVYDVLSQTRTSLSMNRAIDNANKRSTTVKR